MQEVEVEVVSESTRDETESIRESIRDEWIGALTAYKLAGLTKSSFQRAISHLLGVRGCRVEALRRGDGKNTRYSGLAIELIKAHKSGNDCHLQHLLEFAAKPASSNQPTQSLVTTGIDRVATLDEKIARLQAGANTARQLNGDRLREKLNQIAACNQAAQARAASLSSAELLAAENRGVEQAFAIFSAEEEAKENTLAHLRALKISGNQ